MSIKTIDAAYKDGPAPMTVYRAVDVAGIEVAADTGSFTGYAMTWAYDEDGFRFEQGSLARSIKDREGKIPVMIRHHKQGGTVLETVGFLTDMTEDHVGLLVRGEFLDTELGQVTRAQACAGGVKCMSTGTRPLRYQRAGRVIRVQEAKLLEVTLTNVPSDPGAEIQTVRTGDAAGTPAPPPRKPSAQDTPEAHAARSRRITMLSLGEK